MSTSLNSIVDANQMKKPAPKGPAPTFSDFAEALNKMGQRHGKKDKALVQKGHDACAELVDGLHCVMGDDDASKAAHAAGLQKANARHSKKDLEEIKKAHDIMKGLGAECMKAVKETDA